MRLIVTILILGGIFGGRLSAQNSYIPLNDDTRFYYDREMYASPESHPSVKPYILRDIVNIPGIDSLYHFETDRIIIQQLGTKHMFSFGNEQSYFRFSPLVDLAGSLKENDLWAVNYGASAYLSIGDKLDGHFNIISGRSGHWFFSSAGPGVVPHMGPDNIQSFSTAGYTWMNGYLSFSPSKYISFQAGKDKNFLGDGYRSLLLSDNSDSYPFFKAVVNIWKVKYIILYNIFRDVDIVQQSPVYISFSNPVFHRKYATTHYLSWNLGKRINFNLFETVIWRGEDSLGTRGFDVNYMNPIIFFRPVEFSLGSPDNVIMGGGARLRIWKNTHLYHQFVLDEFKLAEIRAQSGWWANKYGFQFGVKSYDILKIDGLYAQAEVNIMRPFTYSHGSTLENYGHHYQPLAHPAGANFVEAVFVARYHHKRFYSALKLVKLEQGVMADTMNMGNDIYLSYNYNINEYGNTLLQGRRKSVLIGDWKAGFVLNPEWNLCIEAGIRYYDFESYRSTWLTFGLHTNLYNLYKY